LQLHLSFPLSEKSEAQTSPMRQRLLSPPLVPPLPALFFSSLDVGFHFPQKTSGKGLPAREEFFQPPLCASSFPFLALRLFLMRLISRFLLERIAPSLFLCTPIRRASIFLLPIDSSLSCGEALSRTKASPLLTMSYWSVFPFFFPEEESTEWEEIFFSFPHSPFLNDLWRSPPWSFRLEGRGSRPGWRIPSTGLLTPLRLPTSFLPEGVYQK